MRGPPEEYIKTPEDIIAYLQLIMAAKEKYILLYALNDITKAVTEGHFKFSEHKQ